MNSTRTDDRGQMLLATGVVLMMSLLSMAIYGVKMAGLNSPHDTTGVTIQASRDVVESLPGLTEERALIWYGGGLSEIESVENALQSLHDDILHHGEIRGVELKLLNMTATDNAGIITVSGELGAADRNTMMTQQINFSLDLD